MVYEGPLAEVQLLEIFISHWQDDVIYSGEESDSSIVTSPVRENFSYLSIRALDNHAIYKYI